MITDNIIATNKKIYYSLKANHRELPSLEPSKGGYNEPSSPKDSTLEDSLVKSAVSEVN